MYGINSGGLYGEAGGSMEVSDKLFDAGKVVRIEIQGGKRAILLE